MSDPQDEDALIWGGNPLQILEAALRGEIDLAISPASLNETLRVFGEKFDMLPDDRTTAEAYMRRCARVVEPTEALDVVPADPTDNRILECAVAAGSDVIVSGDLHFLKLKEFRGIKIQRPADFLGESKQR